MKPTASNLIRWAGLSAVAAGIIFAGIQPIHPPDVVASVTTNAWAIITPLKTGMAFLFLVGIAGLYARQVGKAGWLGLTGFLMLSVSWAMNLAFIFAEAFIFPPLAASNPEFVDGLLAVVSGRTSTVDLGALPALFGAVGILYMLGGLLFGIATVRARVLPRWGGILLATASALTPLAALLPHHIQRFAAVPVGLSLAWLGYTLWAERRTAGAQPAAVPAGGQLRQADAQ